MSSIRHQHEDERILFRTRRSYGALLIPLLHSVWQGTIAGTFALLIIGGSWYVFFGEASDYFMLIIPFTIILLAWRRYVIWQNITFTITTKRIISHQYHSIFTSSTYAIQWDRYQGSEYAAGALDRLTNTGALTIQYGTMDAAKSLKIIRLPWAQDLKHYMDKLQSLRASNTPDINLPLFVPAKRGKRDRAVLSYQD